MEEHACELIPCLNKVLLLLFEVVHLKLVTRAVGKCICCSFKFGAFRKMNNKFNLYAGFYRGDSDCVYMFSQLCYLQF